MSSEKKEFKPVTVEKPIPVEYDLGNLALFDPNPLDPSRMTSDENTNKYLNELTRDNVQLAINQILSLPVRSTTESNSAENGSSSITLVQLPEPTTLLPREKPLPKAKPPTKWEQFAAKKGIKLKGKEGKMVYDEDTKEWVPKWGYGGKNKKIDDQWLVEVEDEKVKNAGDELIDPRSLSRMERKRLVKKNELQHKRNLKKAEGN